MSKKVSGKANSAPGVRPWGSAIGILAGCVVTLIGIVAGLEPETVALRAVVSGFAVGIVVSAACGLVRQWSA